MEIYTIGRFALPVVLGVVTIAAFLMVVTMIFTTVMTIAMVQRLSQHSDAAGRSPVTIHFHAEKAPSQKAPSRAVPQPKPPMQAQS